LGGGGTKTKGKKKSREGEVLPSKEKEKASWGKPALEEKGARGGPRECRVENLTFNKRQVDPLPKEKRGT